MYSRFTSNGALDFGFGVEGHPTPIRTVGGLNFYPRSKAIDSQGRVLLFGQSVDPGREYVDLDRLRGFPASWAVVVRLRASGELDPSFGNGDGFFLSDYGLPTEVEGTELPTTHIVEGIVDAQDRPIFAVATLGPVEGCVYGKGFVSAYPRGVARLTVDGAVDTSFGGGDGLAEISGGEGVVRLEEDDLGGLAVATESGTCERGGNRIFRFDAGGEPLVTFGKGGNESFSGLFFSAVDSSGAIVLSETLRRGEELTHAVVKLKPNGRPDRRFGKGGRVDMELPWGFNRRLEPVGIDARGGIVLVGSFDPRKPPARGKPKRRSGRRQPSESFLFVTRLRANGKVDRNFGNRGRIVTRFKQLRFLVIKGAALDSQDRLVVAVGSVSAGQLPDARLTLVRYLLDS